MYADVSTLTKEETQKRAPRINRPKCLLQNQKHTFSVIWSKTAGDTRDFEDGYHTYTKIVLSPAKKDI
jgi:hypothetical protein